MSLASRPLRRFAGAVVLSALTVGWTACRVRVEREPAPRIATHARAVVVSPEDHAGRIGVDVLRAGGNAADAAIAVHFALAVSYPQAGNLGGGGFMLYRDAEGRVHALDFRETAPRETDPGSYLDEDGRPKPDAAWRGGPSVGVPGSVAGMEFAHRRWGSLPWRTLVLPSAELARAGWTLNSRDAALFADTGEHLRDDPDAAATFAPDGRFPRAGERLRQPDLSAVLERIAREGASAFYTGAVARAIVDKVRERGGRMTPADLAAYRPVEREPLRLERGEFTIVTFPPPSSGGVALAQMLSLAGRSTGPSAAVFHRMIEAERRAYADRSRWLGDPEFVDVPVAELLDPGYLARRASSIDADRATPSPEIAPGRLPGFEPEETLHFSIVAPDGSAASVTTTLNGAFGSGLLAPGTGILLNNEMDDFALAPGVPNAYGLTGGAANVIAPGKRPLSSMTPTLVLDAEGRTAMALGSPGGSRIITAVYQVLVHHLDWGLPLGAAVDRPRFHHQWLPDAVVAETGAFDPATREALEALGHRIVEQGQIGNVCAVARTDDGWIGVADARRGGTTRGF